MNKALKNPSAIGAMQFPLPEQSMIAYWDSNLLCRYANNAYLTWFGAAPADMINKMTLDKLLGPIFYQNLPYINAALKGKIQVFERELTIASGERRQSLATYYPDVQGGRVRGFFVLVSDITFIKENIALWPVATKSISPLNDKVMDEVVRTLEAHLFNGFPGIKTLASLHFISQTKLKRDFKRKFSTTPLAYYRQLQMQQAEEYLSSHLYNKKQVAGLFGFSNPSNFSACYNNYCRRIESRKTDAGQ
jgi:AraC-like DNA-binding protein